MFKNEKNKISAFFFRLFFFAKKNLFFFEKKACFLGVATLAVAMGGSGVVAGWTN